MRPLRRLSARRAWITFFHSLMIADDDLCRETRRHERVGTMPAWRVRNVGELACRSDAIYIREGKEMKHSIGSVVSTSGHGKGL
ncbi:hypothetical protein B0T22DRAFT_455884 [Podospora appendiculata]|uniref:Uncharacterized protein n=1 Tax=Podospora appendiculata TaxID=314037 RepID=A0AAE0XLD8_9PEZI|nr:hypothetical protein B0T22DRAFT_455884 [Podospora appendiculata]